MSLKAKVSNSNSKIDPIDPGTYPARLVQLIDLGLQTQRPFKGEKKVPADRILLTYEFLDEFIVDEDGEDQLDKPRFLSEDFVNYTRKADRSLAASRIGALDPEGKFEGFDPSMVGVPVMVTVIQNPSNKPGDDRVFNNITGVAPMRPKDVKKAPNLVNPGLAFDFDQPDLGVFLNLSEWVQKKIKEAVNYKGSLLSLELEGAEENNSPAPMATVEPEDNDGSPY